MVDTKGLWCVMCVSVQMLVCKWESKIELGTIFYTQRFEGVWMFGNYCEHVWVVEVNVTTPRKLIASWATNKA